MRGLEESLEINLRVTSGLPLKEELDEDSAEALAGVVQRVALPAVNRLITLAKAGKVAPFQIALPKALSDLGAPALKTNTQVGFDTADAVDGLLVQDIAAEALPKLAASLSNVDKRLRDLAKALGDADGAEAKDALAKTYAQIALSFSDLTDNTRVLARLVPKLLQIGWDG